MFVLKISILVVLLALTSAEESEELPAKNIQKRGILLDIISQSVAARLKQGGGKEIQAPLLQWKEPRRIELQLQKGEYGTTSVQGRLDLGGVNYAPEQIRAIPNIVPAPLQSTVSLMKQASRPIITERPIQRPEIQVPLEIKVPQHYTLFKETSIPYNGPPEVATPVSKLAPILPPIQIPQPAPVKIERPLVLPVQQQVRIVPVDRPPAIAIQKQAILPQTYTNYGFVSREFDTPPFTKEVPFRKKNEERKLEIPVQETIRAPQIQVSTEKNYFQSVQFTTPKSFNIQQPRIQFSQKNFIQPPRIQFDSEKTFYQPPRIQVSTEKSSYEAPRVEINSEKSYYEPPRIQVTTEKSYYEPGRIQVNGGRIFYEPKREEKPFFEYPKIQVTTEKSFFEPKRIQLPVEKPFFEFPKIQVTTERSFKEAPRFEFRDEKPFVEFPRIQETSEKKFKDIPTFELPGEKSFFDFPKIQVTTERSFKEAPRIKFTTGKSFVGSEEWDQW